MKYNDNIKRYLNKYITRYDIYFNKIFVKCNLPPLKQLINEVFPEPK